MAWWILLILLFVAWFLLCLAGASVVAIQNAREKLPPGKQHGYSPFPLLLIGPFFFFGLAKLIDRYFSNYGTWQVLFFHVALVIFALFTVLKNAFRLRRIR